MKIFSKQVLLWLGYTIAVVVILAATLVSLSRMLTPYLNSHRHDFEVWANEQLHAPIAIGRVHITWYYNQPVLTFEHVVILDPATNKPNFNIRQIKVNLQVLPSLLHWRPMPKYIKVVGANLVLREQTAGRISIEGVRPFMLIDNITDTKAHASAVVEWILSQPRLVLEDINVRYIPLQDKEKSITLEKLSLRNQADGHELVGNVTLNQKIPLNVQLNVQASGQVTDLPHLSVNAYIYLEGVSLPQWFKQTKWQNMQLMQGLGSAKIWIDWNNAQLQKIRSELQFYDLDIKSLQTQKILLVSRLNGVLGWRRDGDKQIFSGENILIDFPEHLWPTTGFSLTLGKQADGANVIQALSVDYLDIADSLELGYASGFLPEKFSDTLKKLDLSGDIKALNFTLNTPIVDLTNIFNNVFSVRFSKLSSNAWQSIPKMDNLTGQLNWNGQQGQLQLDSRNTTIDLSSLFATPLLFDKLRGVVELAKDNSGGWTLKGKEIEMINADLATKLHFSLDLPLNNSPIIDLSADFSMPNITPINKYMPVKILEPELSHWLLNTFYGGKIKNGQFVLRGKLSDFPFDNNNGKFLVSADIEDLDFEYAPLWPGIKHLNGTLLFSGHKMVAEVASGQMVNVFIKNVHAEIPYIGADQPQILNIQSVIDTDLTRAFEYINHSPLQKTIGNDLAGMLLKGGAQLSLSLSIPLKTPENTLVIGDLIIPKAELSLPDWNLKLDDLSGTLHFTEHDIKANDIKANLLNQKIALNIDSKHPDSTSSVVVVTFQSKITQSALQDWFKLPESNILTGSTNYNAQLNLTSDDQSQPSQLIITSDLKGMSVNLPGVYGKPLDESRNFQFLINMNKHDEGLGIKLTYGDVVTAAVTLRKNNGQTAFDSGEVHLGTSGSANFQTKPGLLISGQFDKWDLSVWQGYAAAMMTNNKSKQVRIASAFNLNMLRGVDISANQFSGYGLSLHAARIQAMQEKNGWSINVNSNEMIGSLNIPNNIKSTVDAKFQRLTLSSFAGTTSQLDPKKIPPISFVSDDVQYNDLDIGRVSFITVPTSTGLRILKLQSGSSFYNFNAKGDWSSNREGSRTNLQGLLETKDVAALLRAWGIKASNLVESGGNAEFNLNWNGAPYHPDLSTVIGDLSLKLTAGRIVDLSNSTDAKMGIGKMLNIFNLSNIPRRLSLNFKDFKNGYSFDYMRGHFNFKNGSLLTQDTVFNGPIARIEIAGRIGFVAKDYDINYSVTPYGMTSSLPIVATVVGGPIAGAATWLVDKVVGGAVSSVISHHYSVRGPWSHPEWSEK